MSQESASQGQEPAAGDDLFQFDEHAPEAAAALPGAAPEPAPAAGAPPKEPALQPMGLVDDTHGDPPASEPAPERPHAGRGPLPPLVVPLLLVMAAANLALVGLTWKSLRAPASPAAAETEDHGHASPAEHAPHESAGKAHGEAAGESHGEPHGETGRRELPRLSETRQEAWASLDDAERALEAGEFVAARRALYALLAVLDRVDLAERPGIEARAGYVIAETYRRQAQAMAEGGAPEAVH